MTMPAERTRALMQTREFLQDLMDSEKTPLVPEVVRREARRLLRHYPLARDVQLAHLALPNWFGPPDDDLLAKVRERLQRGGAIDVDLEDL
jgi:hypothetical protein